MLQSSRSTSSCTWFAFRTMEIKNGWARHNSYEDGFYIRLDFKSGVWDILNYNNGQQNTFQMEQICLFFSSRDHLLNAKERTVFLNDISFRSKSDFLTLPILITVWLVSSISHSERKSMGDYVDLNKTCCSAFDRWKIVLYYWSYRSKISRVFKNCQQWQAKVNIFYGRHNSCAYEATVDS